MNKARYVGINCSKCGQWVGRDGFHDYDKESREMGYPLCKRCLDARGPTIYDLEVEIRELKATDTMDAKERIADLEKQIENRRGQIRCDVLECGYNRDRCCEDPEEQRCE